MKRVGITVTALILAALPAVAGPADIAAQAQMALDKGYGTYCDLGMKPNVSDPYYKCLDFGPYRVVSEYGRLRGFVILEDGTPFHVMTHSGGQSLFTVSGPWERDMPFALADWWNESLASGRADAQKAEDLRTNAVDRVKKVRNIRDPKTPQPESAAELQITPPDEGHEILKAIGSGGGE